MTPYHPTTEQKERASRVQIFRDIGQLVILYCKKTCLTGQLRVFRFFICFTFPAL